MERFALEDPPFPVFVTDVHNDQELTDVKDPALINFNTGVKELYALGEEQNFRVEGKTIKDLIKLYRANNALEKIEKQTIRRKE